MYFQNFKVFLDFKVFLEFTRIKRNTRGHTLESISSLVKVEACGHTVLPYRSILIGQKWQNSKYQMRHFMGIFDQCENVSQNVTHSLEDLVDA